MNVNAVRRERVAVFENLRQRVLKIEDALVESAGHLWRRVVLKPSSSQ